LGSTVNVHYDPQNPQRAILESTPYANGFLQLIAALLFLFAWRWALKKAKAADALAPAQRAAPPDVEARLNLLIRQGNKMEAIVLCRTSRGMGLKEAKDYVEAVSRAKPSEDLDFRLRSLLKQGKMIDAIKLCHSEGGFDLKDAKEYVESLDAPSGPPIIKE
jgi:ribosomal protein L7/L12